MFLVNRILGINNSSPSPELLTLDGGRLFLVRPDSIKGSRECIFIDASISIRRTASDFDYELVVTRTFQEGEEQLLEEDAENSDERSFVLDSSLFLSLGPTLDPQLHPAPLSFTWLDPEGDGPEDEFEFILSLESSNEQDGLAAKEFLRLCWRCMWEKREEKEWPTDERVANVVEEELEDDFKVERSPIRPIQAAATPRTPAPPASAKKQPLFRPADSDSDDDSPLPAPTSSSTRGAAVVAAADESSGSDSDEELANALMTKANISTPAKSSSSSDKGKGRAISTPPSSEKKKKASALTSLPLAEPLAKPPTSAQPSDTSAIPIVEAKGGVELHLYDTATGLFMLQDDNVDCGIYSRGNDEGFWLVVNQSIGNDCWVSQGIEKDMVINFSERERAMVFNFRLDSPSPSTQTYTWLLRFPSEGLFQKMQEGVSIALFEGKNGRGSWKKLKEDERDYQKVAYIEDAEMYDIPEEERHEEEVLQEEEEEEEETDEEQESERDFAPQASKAKNSQLAVGYKEDLSFVVQGDMIGVFKQQREGGKKLKFVTSIVNIATPDGKKGFTPQKVMLHNQDTSMILQNPLAPGSLYRLDLETGKVVDEYSVSKDFSVSNFIPDSKFAQTTQQQTFIGLSHNGVFRIDPRLAGSKLVDSEFKQYATKNDFSVAATTESGKLAVASNKGDIRLFDKLGKNAKTALPALGDPILGIDVSADGKYVLATCKTYLLLIDTTIPEGAGRYGGSSGFDRSFPAAQKPTPRRLQLRPEHIALIEEQNVKGVSFTPAKFNAGLNEQERTIVTSTGPYIVAWNFRHVKAGRLSEYVLRRFQDTVIADQFKFGGDREIIVTLPGNVFVEEKNKLKAPNRDSISRIVQTWDG